MAAYLLIWNPNVWGWETLEAAIVALQDGDLKGFWWNTGVTKRIQDGDRFYLMRLGLIPKGIIGAGIFRGIPRLRFDEDLQKEVLSAPIEFDSLVPSVAGKMLGLETLTTRLPEMNWTPAGSGPSIPDSILGTLEGLWNGTLKKQKISVQPLLEGDLYRVVSNRRERSPEARRQCIAHYGLNCAICDFNFGEFYGEIGQGIIHVHHLKPLSEATGKQKVDPIKDLRPLCANCHQVIHASKEARTLNEVKEAISKKAG